MAGYGLVLKIRRREERVSELGFMMCHSRHTSSDTFGSIVAVKPKDQDSLPSYSRDAELFAGSLDELEAWIRGIEWAREYDRMLLGKTVATRRERKEQDVRNELLKSALVTGKKEQ